jgi:hypothetical protein
MTCLSIVREHGPVTVAANPIYPLDTMTNAVGAEFTFEVLDADAGELKTLVGEHRCFYIAIEENGRSRAVAGCPFGLAAGPQKCPRTFLRRISAPKEH